MRGAGGIHTQAQTHTRMHSTVKYSYTHNLHSVKRRLQAQTNTHRHTQACIHTNNWDLKEIAEKKNTSRRSRLLLKFASLSL